MTRDPNAAIRAELRRLVEAIPSGEWFIYAEPEVGMPPDVFRKKSEGHIAPVYDDGDNVLRLIAAMRNALPALLDEIDAAQRFIGKLQGWRTLQLPICWKCQVLEERSGCNCAENE